MPGRLAIFTDTVFKKELSEIFGSFKDNIGELKPMYNIPPNTQIPIFYNNTYTYASFGLIPSWAKDNKNININARCETLYEKSSFRESFKSKRCLIPINGWYEWKEKYDQKIPYLINPKKRKSFICAGLYEKWYDNNSKKTILSVALITTEPNEKVGSIHDRMPVILEKEDWLVWLDEKSSLDTLNKLFKLYPDENIDLREVSYLVNKVSNNNINCIKEDTTKQFIKTTLF